MQISFWLYEEKRGLKKEKSNKDVSKLKVKRIFYAVDVCVVAQHCWLRASANLIIKNLHLTCFISISDGFAIFTWCVN